MFNLANQFVHPGNSSNIHHNIIEHVLKHEIQFKLLQNHWSISKFLINSEFHVNRFSTHYAFFLSIKPNSRVNSSLTIFQKQNFLEKYLLKFKIVHLFSIHSTRFFSCFKFIIFHLGCQHFEILIECRIWLATNGCWHHIHPSPTQYSNSIIKNNERVRPTNANIHRIQTAKYSKIHNNWK